MLSLMLCLQDSDMFTLPLGLKLFQSSLSTQWGLYAAGSLLVSIPVVLIFLLLESLSDFRSNAGIGQRVT